VRICNHILVVFVLAGLVSTSSSVAQKQLAQSPRILNAKTVYFDNQTGSDPVGTGALQQLKKWGKFQIVPDRKQADLILLLSADPYKGGNVDADGNVEKDHIPNWNKQSPTRYAYLTVVDAQTGDNLWSAEHVWGGLLTGFNSVGDRLIKELEKQTKK
jgi:hypothetical protein